jgi:hypothetical protein
MPRWKTALAAEIFGEVTSLSMRALTSLPSLWQSFSFGAEAVAVAGAGVLAGVVPWAAKAALHNVTLNARLAPMPFDIRMLLSYSRNFQLKILEYEVCLTLIYVKPSQIYSVGAECTMNRRLAISAHDAQAAPG